MFKVFSLLKLYWLYVIVGGLIWAAVFIGEPSRLVLGIEAVVITILLIYAGVMEFLLDGYSKMLQENMKVVGELVDQLERSTALVAKIREAVEARLEELDRQEQDKEPELPPAEMPVQHSSVEDGPTVEG